ncbi:hypothetical protein Leryth_010088 [Lithospermum erythrorhizon]|nr:hypothetical protein Leryth_010088 [Lithospermum erythrorhizon]
MSVMQYKDGISDKDVHIWNNAVFDEDSSVVKKPFLMINPLDSLESFSSKENQSPSYVSSFKSQFAPLKPINPNVASKLHFKRDNYSTGFDITDEIEIDNEIEEIEMEMNRLASRLEALRINKAQKIVKISENRGKNKFMEQKQNTVENEKREESLPMSSKSKLNRRGLSLGPIEISAGSRRGLSLGPSEIASAMKSKQLWKQDFSTTPIQPMQNRRKSCFWKLEGIDEEKSNKGKAKLPFMRNAVTTIGSKKSVKIDDGVITCVQPKKLFGNSGKYGLSAASKKPVKQGRVVASRYNQISSQPSSAIRKLSLLESDRDESKRCEEKTSKNRPTVEENKSVTTQRRIKKRWEIPSEIAIHSNYDDEKSPQSVSVMHDLLPKLRVGRLPRESPRDSGPAKKVVELIGRKPYFSRDDEMEQPVCQSLSFADEK